MAAIDQINVNIGTEQSPNYVLHDVNDKRISSTAVTTATHLLATDASLSAINPMTIANAASVLGVWKAPVWGAWKTNLNTIDENGFFSFQDNATGIPTGFTGVGVVLNTRQGGGSGDYGMQIAYGLNNNLQYIRKSSDGTNWGGWRILYSQSILSNSTVLGELASALGVGRLDGTETATSEIVAESTYSITSFSIPSGKSAFVQLAFPDAHAGISLFYCTENQCIKLGNTHYQEICTASCSNGTMTITALDYSLGSHITYRVMYR